MPMPNKTKFLLCAVIAATGLSACLTAQENPNYQYSTRYKGPAAEAPSSELMPMEATAVGYAQTLPTDAVTPSVEQMTPQIFAGEISSSEVIQETLAGAPTDLEFEFEDITGTPGYMAFNGDAPLAEPIEYDYSDNLVTVGADIAPGISDDIRQLSAPSADQYAAEQYTVRMGDTVYSLSKRYCVGVTEIQSANGLGADFAIQIGQTLDIPASRC